ncbi:MAG TPA: hypothetical protein VFL73_10725 [Solirubrobacteraceae bacterium]|nr:hypothetical protein [Solirubrobacteraceae bacterium]
MVKALSDEAAWAAHAKVCGSLPGLLGSGPIVVHEPVPKLVIAEQDDSPWASKPLNGIVRYELTLVCPRPFKRALTPRTAILPAGASVSLTNAGNFAAPVDVKTTGPGTVKLRQGTSGAVMRTRVSVGSGTKFDAAARTVRSAAGLDIYDVMASPSEWLSVARESSVPVTNQGTATVELTIYDTYA